MSFRHTNGHLQFHHIIPSLLPTRCALKNIILFWCISRWLCRQASTTQRRRSIATKKPRPGPQLQKAHQTRKESHVRKRYYFAIAIDRLPGIVLQGIISRQEKVASTKASSIIRFRLLDCGLIVSAISLGHCSRTERGACRTGIEKQQTAGLCTQSIRAMIHEMLMMLSAIPCLRMSRGEKKQK